ncbi:MAG: VanW family protein [Defluviitaleaceae bacterium]|nr:VanW family protein [Defluviitaleaceae bacterium]
MPHEHFAHQTPLFRQLKDVDMYLQYNKVENLKIALPRISGVILHPGETLSYWRLIGRPTRRKGYLPGMILDSGRFLAGVGGGLCQLSNLIFWMALHTPLTITERHRHGYDVFPDADRTQPFGSGATCYWNYGDLMLRNDTPHQFQLLLNLTDTHLAGRWCADIPLDYRYEIYEKDHAIQSHFWGNTRHNAIWRKKFDFDNNLLYDEPIAENHAIMMYPPFLPDTSQT